MSTHTPGPWTVDLDAIVAAGQHIAFAIGPDSATYEEQSANAARIVACVNACEGMADPQAEIDRLRAVNADLLAALEHAARSEHHPACKAKGEYSANPEMYCACHVQKARTAIAKAREL